VADAAGRLHFDSGDRGSGRGVYVHRRRECLQAALRGGFARSLRRKVVVSDAAVLSELGLPESAYEYVLGASLPPSPAHKAADLELAPPPQVLTLQPKKPKRE
jgi:hypothetical protein